jgi:hypothetical protein
VIYNESDIVDWEASGDGDINLDCGHEGPCYLVGIEAELPAANAVDFVIKRTRPYGSSHDQTLWTFNDADGSKPLNVQNVGDAIRRWPIGVEERVNISWTNSSTGVWRVMVRLLPIQQLRQANAHLFR